MSSTGSPSADILTLMIGEEIFSTTSVMVSLTGALGKDGDLLICRLSLMPFISFNKKSWLGQQISARLQSRGIFVQEVMELDSIDTIESLVAQGFGVSIVPQRLLANPLSSQLTKISFCDPAESRKLVLVSNNGNPNHQLAKIIDRLSSELIGNHAK